MLPTRKATLIINPAAGTGRGHSLLSSMPPLLGTGWLGYRGGFRVVAQYTTPEPGSAERLARAAAEDSGLVIACGGDGTVHEVVQGLAYRDVALGVIPLGTANALARNLGLPLNQSQAFAALMSFTARRIPLGRIETTSQSRYFILMAGCGPDGALAHGLSPEEKARFGRAAYYAHAARLFLTRRWPAFSVEWRTGGQRGAARAVGLMASRVPDLGGAFSGLTAQASLTSNLLHVKLLRPPAQLSFPAWFGLSRTGLPNPWLETLDVDEIRCTPLSGRPVHAQADAEPMGTLPFTLRLLRDALTLMMPPVR